MRAPNLLQFEEKLSNSKIDPPVKSKITTLQINLGKRCNQSCLHCHVSAGPNRNEIMSKDVARGVVTLVERSPHMETVDITGGAPELNPNFTWLVESIRTNGRRVIDRCNLTVLSEPGMENMADFLAENQVEIVASLPCYTQENVDSQRGSGVFVKSINALKKLNQIGYGMPNTGLTLDLVYNPGSAALPGPQSALQADYKDELAKAHGVRFNRLLTIVNMPICRFADQLEDLGQQDAYMNLLYKSFNPDTLPNVMCRSLLSVSWKGDLFDCDFNQMLDIPMLNGTGKPHKNVLEINSITELEGRPIATASHCFGCTAGAGSSCQGVLDDTTMSSPYGDH
jgi:radical SAM/Cys-rich protein